MTQARNWKHVAKLNEMEDSPIRTATAYKWNHLKRFPVLFRKVGRKLFIDMEKLYAMAEEGKLN